MTINAKNLVTQWIANEYDCLAVVEEASRLKNGIWAFYENGIITPEKRDAEFKKIDKALDLIAPRFEN